MKKHHRQRPINWEKVIWVFIIGSVIGYFYEGILFAVQGDGWKGNSGLVYGGFSQIYGLGAVLITLALRSMRRSSWWAIVIVSGLLGGVFEFSMSWLQEQLFGTISWDYSSFPLNIDGRTTIPFMIVWGFAGLIVLKILDPMVDRLWYKIPQKVINWATVIVFGLVTVNMVISALAAWRMSERANHVPAHRQWQQFFDQHYPDARLKEVYPRMKRV